MSSRYSNPRIMVALCGIAAGASSSLADVWDNSSGNSQWSTASNWADNTEPGIGDFATFPSTIPSGLSTITLASGEVALSLTFLNSYTLNGGNIQLGNGMITAGGGGTVTMNSLLAGSGPITVNGGGTLNLLASSNTFTGGLNINGTNTTVVVRSNTQLGFITAPINLNTGRLRLDGSVNPTFIMSRVITPGTSGGTIDLQNNAFLDLNSALGTNANAITFSGTGIAELNNTTTRTGSTTVIGPVLRLNNANAAGSGQVVLQTGSTLELANGITFNAPIILASATVRGATGVSTLNGSCNIPSTTATVTLNGGLTSSDRLVLGSNGASVWNGVGTTSVNVGTVQLNSANAYTGGWAINGNLQVNHASALGMGTTPISVNGSGRLKLNTPTLTDDITLNNPGGGIELLQDATLTGIITTPGASAFVPFIGSGREFTLAGPASSFGYSGIAIFGGSVGVETFRVINGASVTGTSTYVYGVSGTPGRITVSGAGSTWLNSDEIRIGNIGEGSLHIEAGGALSCPNIYVGLVEDGTALVTGSGSLLTSTLLLGVGFGANGTLSVLDGADITSAQSSIGEPAGASGIVNINGSGSTWTNQGVIEVGNAGLGTLNLTNSGRASCFGLFLGNGPASSGSCTITGALTRIDCGPAGIFMSQNGAASTLNLNGGIIFIDGNIMDAGPGIATLIMDGATLDMMNHSIGGITPIDNLQFRSGTLRNVGQINNGTGLTKTGPNTLFLNTNNTYSGTTTVSQGTLFVVNLDGSATSGGVVSVSFGATLAGPGFISGPVLSSGTVAPTGFNNSQIGTFTLNNSFSQNASGTLDIQIGGATSHDRLAVSGGSATLAGDLRVTLINGFVPAAGDTFTIVTGPVIGSFATTNLPPLPPGRTWEVEYSFSGVRLSVTGGINCDSIDFNNDTSLFDPVDIDAFLSVFSEGPCIPSIATCNDIDFNNDGSLFDPCDIDSYLLVFSEGPCTACGQ